LFRNTDNPGQDLTSETPIAKKVEELTGVTIEWQMPSAGDYQEKIALMCASGDYPDLIMPSTAAPMIYDAGAILKLDDLIDKYGPNIKKFYGGDILKRSRWSLTDKSLYYIPAGWIIDTPAVFERQDGFFIQLAALKDQGYPQITTLADYENAIKNYKEKNPTIDGKPSIGMTLCFDGWHSTFSGGILPAYYSAGYGYFDNDYEMVIDLNTHKSTYFAKAPGVKEAIKWFNHMNSIGLIDPESFVQKFDQYIAKIAQGRVIGFADDTIWHTTPAINSLIEAQKYDRLYAPMPAAISADTRFGAYNQGSFMPAYGVMITKSCKDPVRAIKFLDWLCTDEAQILNEWGNEGVNYNIENGKRVIPPGEWTARKTDPNYYKKTGIRNFLWPLPSYGDGKKDPSGQLYIPGSDSIASLLASKQQPEKDALNAYGIELWCDLFPALDTIPKSPWGIGYLINYPANSKAASIAQTIGDINTKSIVKAMLAKPDDFDAVWAKYLADLDVAGVSEMEKEKNLQVESKIRLFTED
jgi:putative aldouronate transport system substrate-binding protein